MTYAFTFDASSCSGCKACQAACKDKNQLPVGVLWRRVVEVNGGGWQQRGEAWTNTVFAYNLSMACNHCEHPKCAGVCPVDAYVIRPDGVVYIDESKCVGCGYCAWACPYGAPQYNPALGHMTKCNFCFDNIDAGLPPACVTACPLRALDVEEIGEQGGENTEQRVGRSRLELWKVSAEEHPFPLPTSSRTQPHLAIKPHKAMSVTEAKQVANREEIHPRKESAWEEAPLIIFTLLVQIAVGAYWFMLLLLPQPFPILPLSIIGASLGLGMFFSFAHLGTKKNAWRVLGHLRKSWLSREILFASLFGLGWLAVTVESWFLHPFMSALGWLTALFGFALVYSMAQVYRLPAKPVWDTWRTNASFFVSAALLGFLSMSLVITYQVLPHWDDLAPLRLIAIDALCILMGIQLWITSGKFYVPDLKWNSTLPLGTYGFGILALAFVFIVADVPTVWQGLLAFLLILAGEAFTRWKLYQAGRDSA